MQGLQPNHRLAFTKCLLTELLLQLDFCPDNCFSESYWLVLWAYNFHVHTTFAQFIRGRGVSLDVQQPWHLVSPVNAMVSHQWLNNDSSYCMQAADDPDSFHQSWLCPHLNYDHRRKWLTRKKLDYLLPSFGYLRRIINYLYLSCKKKVTYIWIRITSIDTNNILLLNC